MSMPPFRPSVLLGLLVLMTGTAHAETMRCQSWNGNINCASPTGRSCQTINGTTRCVSGGGGVVQSFHHSTPDRSSDADEQDDTER